MDMYVYYFLRDHGRASEAILSKRRATLQAIKSMGEPVMESQIVVDHTEVDANGFLIGGVEDESRPVDEHWAQIKSLERRADSRDCEARQLEEDPDGRRKYMLSLESRELRKQAQKLRRRRADVRTGDFGANLDTLAFADRGGNPSPG